MNNPCFVCGRLNSSNKELRNHIKQSHSIDSYQCGESTCFRRYSNSKSFMVHRNRDHPDWVIPDEDDKALPDAVNNESYDVDDGDNFRDSGGEDDNFDSGGEDGNFDNDGEGTSSFLTTACNIVNSNSLNKVTILLAYFYSLPDVVRKKVPEFIQMFSSVFAGKNFVHLESKVCERLSILGESVENLTIVKDSFKTCFSPFKGLETEHLIFKHFVEQGTYFPPESLTIGYRDEYIGKKNSLKKVPCTMEFIPMRLILKRFFEIPKVFQQIMAYYKILSDETSVVSNIVQAEYWKTLNIPFDLKQPVFPISVYFDDLESNNPLGSHAGVAKVGAVYLNLPCLPPNFVSKIENIFLFSLFHSLDRSTFGNGVVFSKIIDELQYLEREGVIIEVENSEVKILFKFVFLLGDNLGLHSLLGFVESFSGNYPCRFCLTPRSRFNEVFRESECVLRNHENYESDLNNKDRGIKERCVFNLISNFHPTTNFAVDYMHDFYEGVVRYDVGYILHKYIQEKKIFSLELLNDRRNGFVYDVNDKRNKPPEITPYHVSQKTFSMSASETKCFLKVLPFLIGDKVNDDCELWKLIMKLRNLSTLFTAKDIHRNSHELLGNEITTYLQALKEAFPEYSFKPKHHHLLHYSRVMKMIGPLYVASSFRNESKHQTAKQTANVSRSRVNVTKTMAIKNQLLLNYRLLTDLGEYPPFLNGSCSPPMLIKNSGIDEIYFRALSAVSGPNYGNLCVRQTNMITYLGYTITSSSILIMPEEDGSKCIEICNIFLLANFKVIILGSVLHTVYNFKYDTYKIFDFETTPTCILFKDLIGCSVAYKARLAPIGDYYVVK